MLLLSPRFSLKFCKSSAHHGDEPESLITAAQLHGPRICTRQSGAQTARLRERTGGSVRGGGSCRGVGAPRRRAWGGAGPTWPRATRPASSGAPGTVSPEDAACEPKAETPPGFRLCLPSPRTGQGLQAKVPHVGARGLPSVPPLTPREACSWGVPLPRARRHLGAVCRPQPWTDACPEVGASTWSQSTPRSLWGMPSRLQPTWPERNVGVELPDLPIFQKKPKTWTAVRTVPTSKC